MADSIAGKIGVSAKGGIFVPTDGRLLTGVAVPPGAPTKIETDSGNEIGGGLMYGINDNVAAEVDVLHARFHAEYMGIHIFDADTTAISLGLQYRFNPTERLVPYLGAGFDMVVNDLKTVGEAAGAGNVDVDTSYGGHFCAGLDFFITSYLAVNAELRGVITTEADMKDPASGVVGGKFDPSNFTGILGMRVFL